MKKFLSLFIFVLSATAFGQTSSPKIGITDDFKHEANLSDSSTFAVKQAGDESVARVLDEEFAKLGYNDQVRLSILGDVGRENNWNRKTIFKGHPDPKNRARNRGIISWQGSRRKKLDAYLKQQGLLGRGDDAELRGMAQFMHSELQDEFPDVYKELAAAKDTASASNALQKYIKYVPRRPYNSPDSDFKVSKNAVWAKKARAIGLGRLPDPSGLQAGIRNESVEKSEQSVKNNLQKSL
ncbi:MAG: phage tail tip lysozyme [Pyrinomonadaceae bacterium]